MGKEGENVRGRERKSNEEREKEIGRKMKREEERRGEMKREKERGGVKCVKKNVREWMRVKECGRVGMNRKRRNS